MSTFFPSLPRGDEAAAKVDDGDAAAANSSDVEETTVAGPQTPPALSPAEPGDDAALLFCESDATTVNVVVTTDETCAWNWGSTVVVADDEEKIAPAVGSNATVMFRPLV